MRARPVVILAGLCVGLIFVVRLQIRSYLEDGYNVLPLVYIDFVKGDTFSNPLDIMALAERVSVPQNGSYVFISVLTATKFHDARLSRMFVSWMQTVEPKQVAVQRYGAGFCLDIQDQKFSFMHVNMISLLLVIWVAL